MAETKDTAVYLNVPDDPEVAVKGLLNYFDPNPDRPGIAETPKRVAKAFAFMTQGYKQKPEDVLKTFEDGAEGYKDLLIQKNIPVWSMCEHHLLPFFGVAHIAYIPNGRVVGLSKLSRLLDIYARRFQIQERLTSDVANALMKHLKPLGVGVVLECRHTCMESRGVERSGSVTITSALRGAILNEPSCRAEFMSLAKRDRDF